MPRTTGAPGDNVSCYTRTGFSEKGQIIGIGQPKDLFSLYTKSNVSASEVTSPTNVAGLTPTSTQDATYLMVGGSSTTASTAIGFVVALYDATGVPLCVTDGKSLACGTVYKDGSRFLAVGPPVVVDLCGAASFAIIATSVTGTWNINARPY
jgi:hypothetical protein